MPIAMSGPILPTAALRVTRALILFALVGVPTTAQGAPGTPADSPSAVDPLVALGVHVTGGAAPGYVSDQVCARCHPDLAESYRQVGMFQSFYRPAADRFIEDFKRSRFVHGPSGRHYEMVRTGDDLLFRRWEEDDTGQPINLFERKVDWVMGSGHHSRVYLYQTPLGELYQLPTAWYTQEQGWGMAPGFDRPDHLGVIRRVPRECMFCHNAYPDVPSGNDAYGEPHRFPADLPEGTGCQRCHGPGAEHVRLILGARGTIQEAREAIVNPGRLPPERRNDICYECHMQPSVAIPGVRRFDRNDYSFRPGERLADYRVAVDIVEPGREPGDRFEINHHPYRLEQSTCFRESGGALSCLTCHDPHRKVPPEERAAHYRSACLDCHEADACSLDAMTGAGADALPQALRATDPGDCVTCHMPLRRTEDVVHVTMTDHLIRRTPEDPEKLLAPRQERDPEIVDVVLLEEPGDAGTQGALREAYRAVAVIRTGARSRDAVDHLDKHLDAIAPDLIVPRLDLAEAQLNVRRAADAEVTLRTVLERSPGDPQARDWLALALAGQGKLDAAEAVLRALAAEYPDRPETQFNLGRILLGTDRPEAALPFLRRATELRPNQAAAWLHLGRALARLDRPAEAREASLRSLAIDPTEGRAYIVMADLLRAQGNEAEAQRYLRHGLRAAKNPEPIQRALEEESAP